MSSPHGGSSVSGLWATVWPQALAPRSAGGFGRTGYSGSRRVSPQTTIGGWRNPPRPRVPRRAPRLLSPAPLAGPSCTTRSATRPLGARPRTPPRPCRRRGCEPSRPGVPPRRVGRMRSGTRPRGPGRVPRSGGVRPTTLSSQGPWVVVRRARWWVLRRRPRSPDLSESPRCRCVPSRRAAHEAGVGPPFVAAFAMARGHSPQPTWQFPRFPRGESPVRPSPRARFAPKAGPRSG